MQNRTQASAARMRADAAFQAPPPPDPSKLSNTAFLAAIFADAETTETLWTCQFTGSPATDPAWSGAPLTPGEAAPESMSSNTYFSVASLRPDVDGAIYRRLSNFGRLFALVLDDAGSVPGIEPTWILRTSKPNGRSNTQVGYRLSEPVADVDLARRIHNALAAAGHIQSDKSGNNPVRYVRLPIGSNTKHSPPHPHKLLSWHPDRAYPVETLIQALRLELDPAPREKTTAGPDVDLSTRSFFGKANSKAMGNLPAWVPVLFPRATAYQGGYRVASTDLGRVLEEDIGIQPEGIKDFGEETTKTPIDLVIDWGNPSTPLDAAVWLCDRLGIDPATLGMGEKRKTKEGQTERTEASEAGAWADPEPLPGDQPSVQPFTMKLLPAELRPWVEDVADRMQCPPDYPAVAAMIALAAVVGRQIGIRPKARDDWTVVPNLWGAVIGRPSLLKTPAIQEPMRMIDALEAAARKEFESATLDHAADELIREAENKESKTQIGKAVKEGNRTLAQALAREAAEELTPPGRRRYKTQDTTVEKLGEILKDNPRGVLIYRDELIGFLRSMDQEGRETSRAFYLEAWNGLGSYTSDRIGRGTIEIDAACVSIIGAIQPGPMREYIIGATQGGRGDDGLMQRFQLAVWPDPPRQWVNIDRWPDTRAKAAAREIYQRLDIIDATALGATLDEGDPLPWLRFAPDAQELFNTWRAALEARLQDDDLHPALEAHLAKYRSLAPTLALLSHLADHPEGGPVGEPHLMQALAWCEYLESHARRIYAPALTADITAAAELYRRLGRLPSPFAARDIYRNHWSMLDAQGTARALTVLEDYGWIRALPTEPGPGRPTTRYVVHPSIGRATR